MDVTKISSQQMVARKGYPGNPMGLYNYESYTVSVPWFMNGWPSAINGNIHFLKVNNVCTVTLDTFANPNAGVTVSSFVDSGAYRIPRRFWPRNPGSGTSYYCITVQSGGANVLAGKLDIYNNKNNVNDPLNGRLRVGQQNVTGVGFTDLSGRILSSSVTYETASSLNE
jgi:hypothetical protein